MVKERIDESEKCGDVSIEIETITLSDGIKRHIIDTYDKMFYWINKKFEEQNNNKDDELTIDLSNTVICLDKGNTQFYIRELCEKKIDGINCIEKTSKNEILYEIQYKVNFLNSFIYKMIFWNTKFCKNVNFTNVHLIGSARLDESIFESFVQFDLTQVDLTQINLTHIDEDSNIITKPGGIFFNNITFMDRVTFNLQKKTSRNIVFFNNNTFEKNVTFNSCCVDSEEASFYDFSNSIFNGDVLFDGKSTPDKNSQIISNINFNDSHFNKKLKIWNVKLGSIFMQNCRFNDSVSITHNYYDKNSELDFSFSTINGLFFIDSDLGSRKGETIKLSNEISFSQSLITKDAFIFFRNINNGPEYSKQGVINFAYANILGTVTVQDSKLEVIKLAKSTLIGNINIEDVDTGYDCRESIAKIKDSFLKRNDVVNSLAYKAKEMVYYSDSLSESFSCTNLKALLSEFITSILTYFKSFKFNHIIVSLFEILFKYLILPFFLLPLGILLSIIPIKQFEKIREYTLLYINRISNSFGMSWGRGIFFTCVTACAFFILINTVGININIKSSPLFVWGWNGWDSFGDVWKYYLNMFYLLDFKDKFSGDIKLNALGETLFFVSKIFVSYGIYQTISAFRKYGK